MFTADLGLHAAVFHFLHVQELNIWQQAHAELTWSEELGPRATNSLTILTGVVMIVNVFLCYWNIRFRQENVSVSESNWGLEENIKDWFDQNKLLAVSLKLNSTLLALGGRFDCFVAVLVIFIYFLLFCVNASSEHYGGHVFFFNRNVKF